MFNNFLLEYLDKPHNDGNCLTMILHPNALTFLVFWSRKPREKIEVSAYYGN